MKIEVTISTKRLHDLIEGAGSAYWAKNFKWNSKTSFSLVEHYPKVPVKHKVTREMLRKGLVAMAKSKRNEGGWHFPNVMEDGTDDMYTGDALIQYAIFGELKYG